MLKRNIFNKSRFINYSLDLWTGFIIGRFCIGRNHTWIEYSLIVFTFFLFTMLLEFWRCKFEHSYTLIGKIDNLTREEIKKIIEN